MSTDMTKEAPETSSGNSGVKYGTGPNADPARKPKDLPRVSSESIVRHGHVV